MLFDPPAAIRYDPSVETPEKDEEETFQALNETMAKIREKTLEDGGHPLRSVHAKSHGLLNAELEVFDDLPASLKQGLFAKAGRYPVVMRFSTLPGDVLDDSVSTPRGLAIKVYGVEGERLPAASGATQDFVMVNGPAFASPNAKAFLANLKLLAATTDKAEGAKKVLSGVFRGLNTVVEGLSGAPSPTLATLGGQAETHILGDSFYTQVPHRYGDYIAKVSVAPASDGLKALHGKHIPIDGHPTGIRDAVVEFFHAGGGEWDVRVQLCTDLHDMPIEDAHKKWDEDKSPYLTVGRITAQPQTAWSEERSAIVDDGMSFSPWHGLAAHRPLGSIMRARKASYEQSARFRQEKTGHATAESTGAELLPA